jgi:group I intron endonuclease
MICSTFLFYKGVISVISGIYMIRNLVNNKVYVGKSVNVEKRFNEHKRKLISNTHDNIHLQRAWNTYGKENFSFTIIKCCEESLLNEKEIYYIKELNSNNMDFGYNLTDGGDGATGYRHTEETKKKIAELQIGKKMSNKTKINMSIAKKGKKPKNLDMIIKHNIETSKQIIQINIDEKTIMIWNSIQECARETNIFATNIVKCLKGTYKTCGNSIFLYKGEFELNDLDIDLIIKERTFKQKTIKGIVKLSLDLKFIEEYSSMKELEPQGYVRQYLRLCCIGKKESYKGFKWMYKKDYEQLTLN